MRSWRSLPLLVSVSIGILSSAAASAGPGGTGPAGLKDELLRISEQRVKAMESHDKDIYSGLTGDDFLYTDGDGAILTKGEVLKMVSGSNSLWPRMRHDPYQDVRVLDLGSSAVLMYGVTFHAEFPGGAIVSDSRRSELYEKRKGSWVIVALLETPVPHNQRSPVKVDPAVLKNYVGQYEWAPGIVETITLEDGRLMTQENGESKDEMLPANETTFFFHADLAEIVFEKGPDGAVTGHVYRTADGQQVRVKKIK